MLAPSTSIAKRVIIVRRQPLADRTVQRLRDELKTDLANGTVDVVPLPLFALEDTGVKLPMAGDISSSGNTHDGVIITSQSVLEILTARGIAKKDPLLSLPLFCVGERTAKLAREFGFSEVAVIAHTASDLAKVIAEKPGTKKRYLYLCGEDRAVDMRAQLAGSNHEVHEVELYRVAAKTCKKHIIEHTFNKKFDSFAVPLYSVKQAEHFLAEILSKTDRSIADHIEIIAISETVTEVSRQVFSGKIKTASQPNEAAIFASIREWVDDQS